MNLCTSFIVIISFNRECSEDDLWNPALTQNDKFPHPNNPYNFPFTSFDYQQAWTHSGWWRSVILIIQGSRKVSDVEEVETLQHADNDLHEKYGAKQLLHGPFFITNNMCANFHTSLDSFIVLIDYLAPSVSASLPIALISNSGSDGLYPSITVTSVAAEHLWSVGVCRHYH